MRYLIVAVGVLALTAALAEAGKQKGATVDDCVAMITNIGSSGEDTVLRIVQTRLPVVHALLAKGNENAAHAVADAASAQIHHRGHVTILKIQETTEDCLEALRAAGASVEELAEVAGAGAAAAASLDAAVFRGDSFFDIF